MLVQEDSVKTGKVTSAGMFFLGFPVYRFEQNNSVAAAKDPDSAFFKRLDGFQPCEVNELKAGTHFFAVYGTPFILLLVLVCYPWRCTMALKRSVTSFR
jgi:hypothetical protein